MRVLIVDDEPLAIEWLAHCLETFATVELVGAASQAVEADRLIASAQPDLVLLDISMPGESGLCLAKRLAARGGPEVVFVTAFAQFAPEAFTLDAVDYILKPVQPDRLREAISRAERRLRFPKAPQPTLIQERPPAAATTAFRDMFWVARPDGFVRVDVADIQWIEAARDYVLLHTKLKTFIYRTTMRELGLQLDPAELTRVHRSSFVRLEAVRFAERARRRVAKLHLKDGAVVDVGVSYADDVAAALRL